MKTAVVDPLKYAPDTRLSFNINSPSSYSFSTTQAIFELKVNTGVTFQLADNGEDMLFSGQTLIVNIRPTVTGDIGGTFGDMVASHENIPFNLDIQQTGSSIVDYRIQGFITNLPSHGPFNE